MFRFLSLLLSEMDADDDVAAGIAFGVGSRRHNAGVFFESAITIACRARLGGDCSFCVYDS